LQEDLENRKYTTLLKLETRCGHMCSADPGQRLLAVEGLLGELLEKRARLQRLRRASDTRQMLAFFRDNGVMHESGRAVQKLLEQEALLKGTTVMSKAGAHVNASPPCILLPATTSPPTPLFCAPLQVNVLMQACHCNDAEEDAICLVFHPQSFNKHTLIFL
jgi:hypothetical protein